MNEVQFIALYFSAVWSVVALYVAVRVKVAS